MSGLPTAAGRLLAGIVVVGALLVGWLLARDTEWWRDLTASETEVELPSDLTEQQRRAIRTAFITNALNYLDVENRRTRCHAGLVLIVLGDKRARPRP